MTNNMKLHREIVSDIRSKEDKEEASYDKDFHKYEHRSYGIKSPVLDKILKSHRKEIKALSCEEVFALARNLYKGEVEEEVVAGNFVLQERLDCFTKKNVSFLDDVTDYLISWSTTDDFCIDVLQPTLKKYPKQVLSLLKKWNTSESVWKRRASVVAFVRTVGESGKYTNEALKFCENLLYDEEDLVKKGVGWCLKDVMRGDKMKVLRYIKELRRKGVSSIITLYALRDLTGKERKEVLAVKP